MNTTSNRPPILRFLILFAGMLASALALAALSPVVEPTASAEPSANAPRGEPAAVEAPRAR